MNEFLEASCGFPAVLFSTVLIVTVGFWLLVLCGAVEHDAFDGDVDGNLLGTAEGVPVAVAVSLMNALAWFTSLTGSILLHRSGIEGSMYAAAATAVLLLSLFLAWCVSLLLLRPLASRLAVQPEHFREDFLGLTCTIRTGRVDQQFGQAEAAARDGSTALLQVRQSGDGDSLTLGSTGLLYAYDEAGEFFWVAPYDSALDPRTAR
ncbi:hypothetical protein [Streptomyces sp. NPDC006879]|uniref:hypothetical protein n=1 Tax=Streptomyces sp. NPDC006879 TaxID=3364767 RepID=UPI003693DE42